MMALVSFTLQRKLRSDMHRRQLLGDVRQPDCLKRPAVCISGGSTFVPVYQIDLLCLSFLLNIGG